ncbi:hypothetical protein FH972_002617 [Carpinus fangiana]|uniref:Uncharacterized protein n=1 Tax=Carpinus fangiana TaxID=176857 RepID=A0A5N6QFE7_9ROSI|nr:hypothetical protein FH972_002617 [Carpinus fangiana]
MPSKSSPCCYATLPDQVMADRLLLRRLVVALALALAGEDISEQVAKNLCENTHFSVTNEFAGVLLVFYKGVGLDCLYIDKAIEATIRYLNVSM